MKRKIILVLILCFSVSVAFAQSQIVMEIDVYKDVNTINVLVNDNFIGRFENGQTIIIPVGNGRNVVRVQSLKLDPKFGEFVIDDDDRYTETLVNQKMYLKVVRNIKIHKIRITMMQ